MTITDNKQATKSLNKAKIIRSEIKEIIGLSFPNREETYGKNNEHSYTSDYLTIQMLDWDNKEIIIELSAYEWINWFDNKTLKRIADGLSTIIYKKTYSKYEKQ
tara:strand:+ start:319 stop:630 length:312 start_codon:yes stop_codon:yes gene_type:complete